jgi:hypothetical protein
VAIAHPRPTAEVEVNTAHVLLTALFSRTQNIFRGSSNGWGFWEVGAYLGLFAIPAALGLLRPRRAAPWILAAVVLWLLARGDAEPFAVWPLLHRLPVFDWLRLPSRLLVVLVLVAGVLAGIGFDWLEARRPPYGRRAALILLIFAAADAWAVSAPILGVIAQFPFVPRGAVSARFVQVTSGPGNNEMLGAALRNEGVVDCYEYTAWPTPVAAADRPGYHGEQYLLGAGRVSLARWSTDVLGYDVDVPRPTAMVVNQNYAAGWRLVEGHGEVFSLHGLLAVRVAAGKQRITLEYRDYWFAVGVLIFLLTAGAATVVVRSERRGRGGNRPGAS